MRNWSAILIDAGLRGLSRAELARELGVYRGVVNGACARYGVDLPRHRAQRRPEHGPKMQARAWQKWAQIFSRATRGATLNQFCRHYKCSYTTAERWAKVFDYKFAPAIKGRARG